MKINGTFVLVLLTAILLVGSVAFMRTRKTRYPSRSDLRIWLGGIPA